MEIAIDFLPIVMYVIFGFIVFTLKLIGSQLMVNEYGLSCKGIFLTIYKVKKTRLQKPC